MMPQLLLVGHLSETLLFVASYEDQSFSKNIIAQISFLGQRSYRFINVYLVVPTCTCVGILNFDLSRSNHLTTPYVKYWPFVIKIKKIKQKSYIFVLLLVLNYGYFFLAHSFMVSIVFYINFDKVT